MAAPLMTAIFNNQLDTIRDLIAAGADVNATLECETPLTVAAKWAHTEAITLLVQAGADPNLRVGAPCEPKTPLMVAFHSPRTPDERLRCIQLLLQHGANLHDLDGDTRCLERLREAIALRHPRFVDFVLSLPGLDINKVSHGTTCLSDYVTRLGSGFLTRIPSQILQSLLRYPGINVNLPADDPPLLIAMMNHNWEVADSILSVPGVIQVRLGNKNVGDTPLALAVMYQQRGLLRKLLAQTDADVNECGEDGEGLLHYALSVIPSDPEIVRTLLQHPEIRVNAPIHGSGKTPLWFAAENSLDNVRMLLDAGADVHQVVTENGQRKTIREWACAGFFYDRDVNERLCPPPPWTGFTASSMAVMDTMLDTDAKAGMRSPAENSSMCPVCLRLVERTTGCMYVHHDCRREMGAVYHRGLYDAYNEDGVISWCTICGRICRFSLPHQHYSATPWNERATLLDATGPVNYFGGEADCRIQGGGGIDEKIGRAQRMREVALELNGLVHGELTRQTAVEHLIEETWNASLDQNANAIKNVRTLRKWTIPMNRYLPNNTRRANNSNNSNNAIVNVPYPNAANPELLPIVHPMGTNAVTLTDDVPNVVQFRHRQKNGVINTHDDTFVGIDTLFRKVLNESRYGEALGRCWAYPDCDAKIYPAELRHILDTATGLTEEVKAEYEAELNKYARTFGAFYGVAAAAGPGVGGRRRHTRRRQRGEGFSLRPAEFAECTVPRRSRRTRRSKTPSPPTL